MRPRSPIRVLCVDDHAVVREGLSAIIDHERDMKVVGVAADGATAVEEYRRCHPDIVLMDLRLPGMSGFEAIREIRHLDARARVIVLTMYGKDEDIQRALQAGAVAYLLKDTLAENLRRVIREVYGEVNAASRPALDRQTTVAASERLTVREEEVVRMLSQGMRDKEIGAALGISEGTVHAHIKRIYAKLHVHDRTAALSVAVRRGIVQIDS